MAALLQAVWRDLRLASLLTHLFIFLSASDLQGALVEKHESLPHDSPMWDFQML